MSKIGIKKVPSILLAATAALVVACGGGGSGMSGTSTAMGTAPVMATGTITGFGRSVRSPVSRARKMPATAPVLPTAWMLRRTS